MTPHPQAWAHSWVKYKNFLRKVNYEIFVTTGWLEASRLYFVWPKLKIIISIFFCLLLPILWRYDTQFHGVLMSSKITWVSVDPLGKSNCIRRGDEQHTFWMTSRGFFAKLKIFHLQNDEKQLSSIYILSFTKWSERSELHVVKW